MINVSPNAKLHIHWTVSPYDYNETLQKDIVEKFSKKYKLPKDYIKVIPEFILLNEKGESINFSDNVIQNVQDPAFQLKLFEDYIELNKIEDIDFEIIRDIDAKANLHINYDNFSAYRKYSVNWIRWSNFLSYGEENYFDFSKLNGLVLVNSVPSNMGGKTTFAVDLLRFLLFGKYEKYEKAETLDKIFNRFNKDATELFVEGSILIDNEEYIIKRIITRPAKRTAKSKVSQKVEYYKIVAGEEEELVEYEENLQGESSVQTNKIIKEAIGTVDDYNLSIAATSYNLIYLVTQGATDTGNLLFRWMGLLPLQEKSDYFNEYYKNEIKPNILSGKYNVETLNNEIEAYKILVQEKEKDNEQNKELIKSVDNEIESLEKVKTTLLSSKKQIDENLLKIDITTLNNQIEKIVNEGKQKKAEIEKVQSEIEAFGDITFDNEVYDKAVNEKSEIDKKNAINGETYRLKQKTIEDLKKSEICPTCGRKYDNIDNTVKIKEFEKECNDIVEESKTLKKTSEELSKNIETLKVQRDNFNKKNKLIVQKSALEVTKEQLTNQYKDKQNTLKEYNKNADAIKENNDLQIQINNNEVFLTDKRKIKDNYNRNINSNEKDIETSNKSIKERIDIIEQIKKEEYTNKHYKLYIDMIGKNGIKKMILRKVLPIINAQLQQLLSDICDFSVIVDINDKNEINFLISQDGVVSTINSASGFEMTAASLALRTVLANISTISKPNYLVLDEIFGLTSQENREKMFDLLDKILANYDFILLITHDETFKDKFSNIITISKENRISKINYVK